MILMQSFKVLNILFPKLNSKKKSSFLKDSIKNSRLRKAGNKIIINMAGLVLLVWAVWDSWIKNPFVIRPLPFKIEYKCRAVRSRITRN